MMEMLMGRQSKAAPGQVTHSGAGTWYIDVPRGYDTLDVILIGTGADGGSNFGGGGGGYVSVQDLAVNKNDRLRLSITAAGTYIYDSGNRVLASVAASSSRNGAKDYKINVDGKAVFHPGGDGGAYSNGYGGGGGATGRYGYSGGDGAGYSTYSVSSTRTRPAWDTLTNTRDPNAYDWNIRVDKTQFDLNYKDHPGLSAESFIIAARHTDRLNGLTYYHYYKRITETYNVTSTRYRVANGTPSGTNGQGQGGNTNEDGEGVGLVNSNAAPSDNGYGYGGGRGRSGGDGAVKIQWGEA